MLTMEELEVKSILTRSTGYLRQVSSHSLNPYRGCSLGGSLCGVACYVQHNHYITRGRAWGSFVQAKRNAAECYRRDYSRERAWAQRTGDFCIFMASATDPFLPQERQCKVSHSLLQAMLELPPERLILQTHSTLILQAMDLLGQLSQRCDLRIHISIESDRDRLPGLPVAAFSVEKRLQAAAQLRERGLWVVATLSPLHPIANPASFFERLRGCVEAVVFDHFIGGDGSVTGSRTRRTALPDAMERVLAGSTQLGYRDEMVSLAQTYFPGRVGVGQAGFAGRYGE